MGSDIAASIRNVVLTVGLVLIGLLVFFSLFFASRMMTAQQQEIARNLPQIVMRTQIEPVLSRSYGAMRTTVQNLVRSGEEFGIAYVGMTDDNGQMHTSAVSSHLPQSIQKKIESNRLVNIEENLIIYREEQFTLSNGTDIREVTIPVRREEGGQTYGAIKIGFIPSAYSGFWSTYRNRMIMITVFSVLVFTILVLIYGQRWHEAVENKLSQQETRLEKQYTEKIEEIKAESNSGPLSPDEFFQIIDFGKKLPKSMEPVDVLRYLVNASTRILNVKSVVIFLLSPEHPETLCGQMGMKDGEWMDRSRLQNIEIEVGNGEIGTIAEFGQTNILDKPRPGAGVAGALRSGSQTIGVLRATEKDSGARMGNKDKLKTRLLCQLSGDIIAHAFEFQELQKGTTNDLEP